MCIHWSLVVPGAALYLICEILGIPLRSTYTLSGSTEVTSAHSRTSNLCPRKVRGSMTYSCSTHAPSGTCFCSQAKVLASLAPSAALTKLNMCMPTWLKPPTGLRIHTL